MRIVSYKGRNGMEQKKEDANGKDEIHDGNAKEAQQRQWRLQQQQLHQRNHIETIWNNIKKSTRSNCEHKPA